MRCRRCSRVRHTYVISTKVQFQFATCSAVVAQGQLRACGGFLRRAHALLWTASSRKHLCRCCLRSAKHEPIYCLQTEPFRTVAAAAAFDTAAAAAAAALRLTKCCVSDIQPSHVWWTMEEQEFSSILGPSHVSQPSIPAPTHLHLLLPITGRRTIVMPIEVLPTSTEPASAPIFGGKS